MSEGKMGCIGDKGRGGLEGTEHVHEVADFLGGGGAFGFEILFDGES